MCTPPAVDQYGLGIRVRGLVISPYSRQGYVDHKTYSFESWLRVVEERFGVMPMTGARQHRQRHDSTLSISRSSRARLRFWMLRGSPYPPAHQKLWCTRREL